MSESDGIKVLGYNLVKSTRNADKCQKHKKYQKNF